MAPAARAASVRLRLLGPPSLTSDEAVVPLAVPQKAIALLTLLVAHHDAPLARSRLAEMLWPDITDEEARANLRRHIHLLARAIGAGAFALTKNSAQWNDEWAPSDIVVFQRWAGDPAEHEHAVGLWHGEPASGIHDDALTSLREEYANRYASMLRALAEKARASNSFGDALRYLERLRALDPLDEQAARGLIETRAASGDRSGALREYNALVHILRTELDVEPERETTQLFHAILYGAGGGAGKHNLPATSTSFVGREADIEAVMLALEQHKLVTLTGPAGVGKTRLAQRCALYQLERYADGVWFVDLTAARTEEDVRRRIAQALDVSGDIVQSVTSKQCLLILDNCEQVWEIVSGLAVELTRAHTRILATSRRRLESACEEVVVLQPFPLPPERPAYRLSDVTGFASVRLFVERAVAVAPSFRMVEENAHSVVDIVRRIDGLALAIELIAARAGLLTPDGMLKRLNDLGDVGASRNQPVRHSTLTAGLEWSYDLLSALEQRIFARASVFAGSFSFDAIQRVCDDLSSDALTPLSELVESSLVQSRHTGESLRFSMLDTVRMFATQRLETINDLVAAQRAHAAHYAELAEQYATRFADAGEAKAFHRADLDADNFMAALRWAAQHDALLALKLMCALWRYWIFRWTFQEPEHILTQLMQTDMFRQQSPTLRARCYQAAGMFEKERADAPRARAFFELALHECRAANSVEREVEVLNALAILEFNHGDPRAAREMYERCLDLQERAGAVKAAAETIANLGAVAQSLDEDERAIELFQRALEGFRATNHTRGIAYALRSLTLSCETLERFEEGINYGRECVAIYESLDEQARLADGLQTLANLLSRFGDQAAAIELFLRALSILSQTEHPIFAMLALFGYAVAAHRAGDDMEAARAFGKAVSLRDDKHLSLQDSYRVFLEESIAQVRAALGERQFELARRLGRDLSLGDFATAVVRGYSPL